MTDSQEQNNQIGPDPSESFLSVELCKSRSDLSRFHQSKISFFTTCLINVKNLIYKKLQHVP